MEERGSGYAVDAMVTGEGVFVDVPSGGLFLRLASEAIDAVILVVLLVAVEVGLALVTAGDSAAVARTMALVALVAVVIGWPTSWETLTRGRTPGKFATGLQTVRDDGGPIGFRQALTRTLIGWAEFVVTSAAAPVMSMLVTRRTKRLGDLAAGTFVMTVRRRAPMVAPPAMPTGYAGWAQSADIAVPESLAIGARQFLSRAATLTPSARANQAVSLWESVAPGVQPLPPAGTPAEVALAAVMAERRRRDALRLGRERALRDRVLPPR